MNPIFFTARFRFPLRALTADERHLVGLALQRLEAQLGRPHAHSGLGVRKLTQDYFELRAGRDLRLLFKLEPAAVTFVLAGNHDDARRLLRGL